MSRTTTDERIVPLSVDDLDELIDFLNRAFRKEEGAGFKNTLPEFYRPAAHPMGCHFAIRRAGGLACVVGRFPTVWHVGEARLKLAGIGPVATAAEHRGQGLMRRLLDHVGRRMREEGCDVSCLGGARQRYGYFGWEVAGCQYRFHVTPANVRRGFAPPSESLRIEPMDEPDPATIRRLEALHRARPMWGEGASFNRLLRHWGRRPWVVRDPGRGVVGYFTATRGEPPMHELTARDDQTAMDIVALWVRENGGPCEVVMPGLPSVVARRLGGAAQAMSVNSSWNWRIFDWPKVTGALLAARCAASPLPMGRVTLGLSGRDEALRLEVDERGGRSRWTDGPADATVDEATAMRLLFGPQSAGAVLALPREAAMLYAWAPLPLSIHAADRV